jgi:hypothetical protein
MRCQLFPFFDVHSALAFAPALTSVLEGELQTVLKTLRGAEINMVAIQQHMIAENPRMIFLHYDGRGKALSLAEGVKAVR